MSIRVLIPWYLRIISKLVLSRLPFNYSWWSRIGLFRHGAMDDFTYAWEVLKKHATELDKQDGWRGLELGPGDGLLSAFLAPAIGSSGLTLIDADDYAHKDAERYGKQISLFQNAFPDASLPDFPDRADIETLLDITGSSYHSHGLQSLRKLESNSFDLIFSQAVLEHVRRDEFEDTMRECYRLLRPDGIMSHVVDYKDHLGGALNNMRFSTNLWERDWFAADSGFYTNRLRISEMKSICSDVGFEVDVRGVRRWEYLPIKKHQLAKEFRDIPDDELLVSGAHLVMVSKQ